MTFQVTTEDGELQYGRQIHKSGRADPVGALAETCRGPLYGQTTGGGMRITELAGRLGVTPRALRYYEEIGLVRPDRTPAGVRTYGADCRRRIELIVALRQAGAPLDQITAVLSTNRKANEALHQEVAAALRARLSELQKQAVQVNGLLTRLAKRPCEIKG